MPKEKEIKIEGFEILRFTLMTEKSIRMIEEQNKMVFIVKRSAKREEIKNAIESIFSSPVMSVNTMIDQKGRKKAFIKFKNPEAAGEIAMRLGII
ncbi:MAG: 50S ribosomal protein L23 [Candidatus Aenigmarchaeota archaeon]|nr:50S ribosomal protein L23 [Candidatus Aenigmarchaeota archaeon]